MRPSFLYLSTNGGQSVTSMAPGMQVIAAEWALHKESKAVCQY
jgi:hypothetical protein